MTWWYRWLCRLSGVLGAVCEYPARGRGRGGRLHRKLRMRAGFPPPPRPAPSRKWSWLGSGTAATRWAGERLGRREAHASTVAIVTGPQPGLPGLGLPGSARVVLRGRGMGRMGR